MLRLTLKNGDERGGAATESTVLSSYTTPKGRDSNPELSVMNGR